VLLPNIYDVENETVCVQIGTAVLPVHEEEEDGEDELEDVLDDDSCVEVDLSLSSSSKSLPISARVSVKFSISSMSGTSASTESTKFLTTFTAQLTSFVTSPIASPSAPAMLNIMLLSRSRALSSLSDSAFLFLFVFEHAISGGLTFKSLNNASASSCAFLTSSRY
jgi:hypothetical protein